MLQNAPEFNSVGGGFGGWGGFGSGFGGIAPIGIVGINNLFDRDRRHDGDDNCAREAAILAAIANNKDATVTEGRNLSDAICSAKEQSAAQAYAAAIQAANNMQAIKDQATAFAIVNDKRFDDLAAQASAIAAEQAAASVAQTAAIIAKLNQTEIDQLRDQLNESRRGRDNDNIHISIQNSNAQAQAQLQAQLQSQKDEFKSLFSVLSAQVAKSNQDIINVGGLMAGVSQSANPVNVK